MTMPSRATQEAEPVAVLVLRDLADEFGTVAAQAANDIVDVVDSEHDAAYAQRVHRRALRLGSDRRRRVELRVPLIVIQRQLGHTNLGITSIDLQGIDNTEIIDTVHAHRAPMVPVHSSLQV
jgi:hypothetical protein